MAHPPPYEPFYLAPPPPEYVYSVNDVNGINTLFVSGLPDDVKAREIHNLFRRLPGFESCQLKYTGRGNQVVAFATFVNHPSAMAAMNSLNGVKFDPQMGVTLHIELRDQIQEESTNQFLMLFAGSGPYVVIDRRTKSGTDAKETSSDDGNDDSDDPATNLDTGNQDNSAADKSTEHASYGNDAIAPENEQADNPADGACSTLFIANLGPNCTEEELKQILSLYRGFNSLKIRAKGGMPVAFADFEKVEHAREAMNRLQGGSLPSSDRGGMHIEYARSKMRKP